MHDIALVGAGRIGKIHAANTAANPRLRLARVVDPFADAAQALAGQYGAAVSTLDAALADPAIKGVIVASSTDRTWPSRWRWACTAQMRPHVSVPAKIHQRTSSTETGAPVAAA